jgi:hypothetical protein
MKVLVDEELVRSLGEIHEPVEIRDATGRTFGYYHPVKDDALQIRSPFSDDELERRQKNPGGRSLSEIWKDLAGR